MEVAELRILIADENELLCWSLSEGLRKRGCCVTVAHTYSEVFEDMFTNKPDAVIMELSMDGMADVDTLRVMKKCRPDISIIATSTQDLDQARKHYDAEFLANYIEKPFSMEEIFEKIQESTRCGQKV